VNDKKQNTLIFIAELEKKTASIVMFGTDENCVEGEDFRHSFWCRT
jgi:hypothetical protein